MRGENDKNGVRGDNDENGDRGESGSNRQVFLKSGTETLTGQSQRLP